MKDGPKIKETILLIAGILFIAAGIACNEWTLAFLFSSDGIIVGPHKRIIWITELSLIISGVMLTTERKSMTTEKIFVITGILLISAGILFNAQLVTILSKSELSVINKISISIFNFFSIGIGLTLILYKYIKLIKQKGNIILLLFSCSFCVAFILLYDFYRSYSLITPIRRETVNSEIDFVHMIDDRLGWKLKPNSHEKLSLKGNFNVTYTIDQDGFKKITSNIEKPDFSMYFFGDSFTFGVGVNNDDTFPNIIKEKYLENRINVYNTAVMGYGIVQMFELFLHIEGRIKKGDLVIFTPISHDILRNVKDFVFPHFLIFTNIVPIGKFPSYDKGVIRYHKIENNLHTKLKLIILNAPYTGHLWYNIYRRFISDTTEETMDMIKIMKYKTEKKGGKFILFFLPYPAECRDGSYFVNISHFDYFDIMHYFPSQKEAIDKIKFKDDDHWNAYGHKIAAKAIVETLINNKIIDKIYFKETP